ncbi:MAG: DUF1592 domain-containing protein [Deltaproteobacteria bacterium]|nr:DUF1592 domain-containing protein [Deltaproteobacteria bacterium]
MFLFPSWQCRFAVPLFVASWFATACTGNLGPSSTDVPTGGHAGNAPKGEPTSPVDVPTPTQVCDAKTPRPGPAVLRRLTRTEYRNTISHLLGQDAALADTFPGDDVSFGSFTTGTRFSLPLADAAMRAAESLTKDVATQVVAWSDGSACTNATDDCARKFIAGFGARAWRRPLVEDEVTALMSLYSQGKTTSFATGLQWAAAAILQSPKFFYRLETGGQALPGTNAVPVQGFEMASRLSYLLWRSMPDSQLFQAAAAGKLSRSEDVAAQARRMLKDPKAKVGLASFFAEWLDFEAIGALSKDPTAFPSFSTRTAASLQKGVAAFVDDLLWSSDHTFGSLMTSQHGFVDAETANIFGVSSKATVATKMALPTGQRAGILTDPGILAAHSYAKQSSPIHRGLFVLRKFMCQDLPAPPDNVMAAEPAVVVGLSTRERFAQHRADPQCAGCHNVMDSLGFGFEHYDAVGAYRLRDGNAPVDATGAVVGANDEGLAGEFTGAVELANRLAQSAQAKTCMAIQWFRFGMSRQLEDSGDDACTLAVMNAAFKESGFDLAELFVALTSTDAFRFRTVAPANNNQGCAQ